MKTLWLDTPGRRHFLIPDDQTLERGALELHTSIGKRRLVAEESASLFEVTRDEATSWSRSELKKLLGKIPSCASTHAARPPVDSGERPLPIFSALSGETPDDLRNDPEALKRGLRKVGADLGALLQDTFSRSDEDRAHAMDRLEELRTVLDRPRADTGAEVGRAREESSEGHAEKAVRSVADLIGSLGRAAKRAGARFEAAADELRAQREAAKTASREAKDKEGGEGA